MNQVDLALVGEGEGGFIEMPLFLVWATRSHLLKARKPCYNREGG